MEGIPIFDRQSSIADLIMSASFSVFPSLVTKCPLARTIADRKTAVDDERWWTFRQSLQKICRLTSGVFTHSLQ